MGREDTAGGRDQLADGCDPLQDVHKEVVHNTACTGKRIQQDLAKPGNAEGSMDVGRRHAPENMQDAGYWAGGVEACIPRNIRRPPPTWGCRKRPGHYGSETSGDCTTRKENNQMELLLLSIYKEGISGIIAALADKNTANCSKEELAELNGWALGALESISNVVSIIEQGDYKG